MDIRVCHYAAYDELVSFDQSIFCPSKASAHAAQGFARVSGQVGVCMATLIPVQPTGDWNCDATLTLRLYALMVKSLHLLLDAFQKQISSDFNSYQVELSNHPR